MGKLLQPRLHLVHKVPVRCQRVHCGCEARLWGARVPYVGAALGLLEAEGHVGAILLGPYYEGVLLLLVAVVLANARLEQLARLVVLRDDDDLGVFLLRRVSVSLVEGSD